MPRAKNQAQPATLAETRRFNFIINFSLVTLVVTVVYGLLNLLVHNSGKGYAGLALAVITVLNIWNYRHRRHNGFAIGVIIFILFLVVTAVVISGGLDGTGVLWLFAFPPIVFFLTGRRWGVFNLVLLLLDLTVLMVLQGLGIVHTAYSQVFLRQTMAALVVMSIIIYFYESINEQDQVEIRRRQSELVEANQELKAEAKQRDEAAEVLTSKSAELEKLNRLMLGRELKMSELKRRIRELEADK